MQKFLFGYFNEEEERRYEEVEAESYEKAWDQFDEENPDCSVFLIVDSNLEVAHAD